MPLGFGPISTEPIGGSAELVARAQSSGGVLVPVSTSGAVISAFLSSVTCNIGVRPVLSGFSTAATLDILSSVEATSPQMTVFTRSFLVSAELGDATGGAQVTVDVTGPDEVLTLLGVSEGFAPTAVVSGFAVTTTLGAVGSGDPWVEIVPATESGWAEIT